ncbi:MAG TPA: alternative ribosome rescue aminoacyl-tRNA hydrolase ArfB [Gemmatimonadales bacterium]|nr:alternative ribosome rescue aminoacyl-tRNA hydrolase ArfB [Gemmatimonadales bacterium]
MPFPSDAIPVNARVHVPRAELEFRASRAGGPGGQHVNTSSSRVELRWDVGRSAALSADERERVIRKLGRRVDSTGTLRIVSDSRRSQLQNREAAVARFQELVRAALATPRARKATRPTKASRERRLAEKRRRTLRKAERRRPSDD